MKKIVMTIALGLLLSVSVSAGQIYGSVKEDRRAVPTVEIQMTCWDQNNKPQPYTTYTDEYGAYTINAVRGKCTFTLPNYKGQSPQFKWIYSSGNSLRYDFDLVKLPSGVYTLRRK